MKKLPLFLLTFLLLAVLKLSAQNPFIYHYTTDDGLPSNVVYKAYQDSKKFIWFCTDAGVTCYDGSNFNTYGKKDGLSSDHVSGIKEDSSGRIWFVSVLGKGIKAYRKINFFYQGKFFNETNTPFLGSLKDFSTFFEDKDHVLYFFGWPSRKIYALDTKNKITKYQIPSKSYIYEGTTYERMGIWLLNKSTTGEFMIWTNAGIFKTRDLLIKPILAFDEYAFTSLTPPINHIWYGMAVNFITLRSLLVKYFDETPVDSLEMPFKSRTPFGTSLEDKNGLLWVSTLDKGVYCFKDKKVIYWFDIKIPNMMMQDYDGNIWICSIKDGVYRINPDFLSFKHYENSLFHNEAIEGLSSNQDGGVWFTNGETIFLFKNNEFYTLDYHSSENIFNRIYSLKNNCMIAGEKNLLYSAFTGIKVEPLSKRVFYKNVFTFPGSLDGITISDDQTNICASLGDILIYLSSPENKFKEIKRLNVGEPINTIYYDTHNNPVVTTIKNAYVINNGEKSTCTEHPFLNNRIINIHLTLNDTTELFSTVDDSIFLYCKKKIFNLNPSFYYPMDLKIRRVIYHKPVLYLSTYRNIFTCNDLLQVLKDKPVQLQLVDINFRNINDILVKNDSLYVCSDDGLSIIPEKLVNRLKPGIPLPYFRSIMINDKEMDASRREITLIGNNQIKFVFGSINYSSTPITYSYVLEGLEHNWTTEKGNNVNYQNLSPGTYIFKVRARKANMAWSKPVEFKIIIKAHFWQHPLFFVFLSLLFTGFIALLIIRRKNIQIKRREIDNQLITLEQKALQSMMNPHFIFNSLRSIQTYLLEKKSSEAGLYLSQFARLIRQNLNAINSASINLEEEIDRLKNYLDLEKQRMENKFDYSIELDRNLEEADIHIPSMIIQPFVENAIWHGIASLEDKGRIDIKFSRQDEKSVTVIIEDNGIGIKRSEAYSSKREKHLHLGMEMTRKRLELLGKKFSIKTAIELFETYPGNANPGTKVVLVMPVGI